MPSNNAPQLVLNEHTKRYTNVRPLFDYLRERCHDNPEQLNARIDNLIRFVCLYFDGEETDSMQLKDNLGFLFDLKDMFGGMQEFKAS